MDKVAAVGRVALWRLPPPPPKEDEGALGLMRTKEAIVKAVNEAAKLPGAERRKKIRALRLKWHPDKNPSNREQAEAQLAEQVRAMALATTATARVR